MSTNPSSTGLAGFTAAAEGYHYAVPRADPHTRTFMERAREMAGAVLAPVYLRQCTHLGLRPRTLGRPRVLNRGQLEIGDDVVIHSRFSRTELIACVSGRLVIGDEVLIEHGALLIASRLLEIGDRVTIGPYCVVADSNSPEAVSGSGVADAGPVWIGDDVILGARVTVLPGVSVGAGSQIMVGSVVSGDIPPCVVAGGNPARPLRSLAARLALASPTRAIGEVGLTDSAQEPAL